VGNQLRRPIVITGVHAILFSPAAEAVREFLRTKIGLDGIDAGGGWLIFALPPAELAVHPEDHPRTELYLMCDDLDATLAELAGKGVESVEPATTQSWGRVTAIALPDGSRIGLYEPRHPRPTR
jgi:hypothetical protein